MRRQPASRAFGRRQGHTEALQDEQVDRNIAAWHLDRGFASMRQWRAQGDCLALASRLSRATAGSRAAIANASMEYPVLENAVRVVGRWRTDRTAWRGGFKRAPPARAARAGLCLFDFRAPAQRRAAAALMRAELPFAVSHMPSLERARRRWTWAYLRGALGARPRLVELARGNRFLYWDHKAKMRPGYVAPSAKMYLPFGSWLQRATQKASTASWLARKADAEDQRVGLGEALYRKSTFAYLMLDDSDRADAWLRQDLPMFDPGRAPAGEAEAGAGAGAVAVAEAALALGSAAEARGAAARGVHCRFAMPATLAQAHFDAGRNFVALVKGHRRYILAPPSECARMYLRNGTGDPSARHSRVDLDAWAQGGERAHEAAGRFPLFATARVVEAALAAGQALFIPSFWIHTISSVDTSVQCNARSGDPRASRARREIAKCGFDQQH
eukprot:g3247.t1